MGAARSPLAPADDAGCGAREFPADSARITYHPRARALQGALQNPNIPRIHPTDGKLVIRQEPVEDSHRLDLEHGRGEPSPPPPESFGRGRISFGRRDQEAPVENVSHRGKAFWRPGCYFIDLIAVFEIPAPAPHQISRFADSNSCLRSASRCVDAAWSTAPSFMMTRSLKEPMPRKNPRTVIAASRRSDAVSAEPAHTWSLSKRLLSSSRPESWRRFAISFTMLANDLVI